MKRLVSILSLLTVLACSQNVLAGLVLTLSPSSQNAAPGTELVFSGTLTNTSITEKVFLNDIALSGGGTDLTLQPNTFFANVPGILLPGETYNGVIFRVALSAGAAAGDRNASVIIKGGLDIFANTDLATASLTVLSPSVSIAATTPDASELGPVSGLFTISRTGGTGIDLPVTCTLSGTAINGTSYNLLPNTFTIPSGTASTTITLTPIPNNVAEGDRTAVLTLASSSAYVVGVASSATVTIHDKPADNWRFSNFGASANDPAAADEADWDKDGITNLMEFALNLNPKTADTTALPSAVLANDYLILTFTPNPAATDVTFVVESSTALTGWSTSDVEEIPPTVPGSRVFRYKSKVSDTARAFLRLRVSR